MSEFKVGDDCIYQEKGGFRWNIKIDYIGKDIFVGTSDEGFELADKLAQIKPSKTPAEIEREKGIAQMFEDAEVQGSNGAFVRLYDKGYRKQQVKPLNLAKFVDIRLESATVQVNYQQLLDGGFIIQGGE